MSDPIKIVDIKQRLMEWPEARPYEEYQDEALPLGFWTANETTPVSVRELPRKTYYPYKVRGPYVNGEPRRESIYYVQQNEFGVFNDLIEVSNASLQIMQNAARDEGLRVTEERLFGAFDGGVDNGIKSCIGGMTRMGVRDRLLFLLLRKLPFTNTYTLLKYLVGRNG